MTSTPAPGPRRRDPKQLTKLNRTPFSRSVLINHLSRTLDRLSAANRPNLDAFLSKDILPWIGGYLKYLFHRRFRFPDYKDASITGVYQLAPSATGEPIRIAIAGDWATGTQESETIMGLMTSAPEPDLTIHLGDVYYVGDAPEVAENCFGEKINGFDGVKWRHGLRGSFALNGNHEMYANGTAYFTRFLQSLGMPAGGRGQIASFFCLETDAWRIIALDTGYNSVGAPILSLIPGINSIPAIGGDCHLQPSLIEWLRNTVQPDKARKGTVLLSHHQYYTAFKDKAYTKASKQLVEFFGDQEVIWLWGHEHRFGIYFPFHVSGGVTAYGRCLGHGGMPVDLGKPDPKKAPIELYDPRTHALDDGTEVGENGFVMLTITGSVLTLDYRDITNKQLLVETFTTGASGELTRAVVKNAGVLKPPPQ